MTEQSSTSRKVLRRLRLHHPTWSLWAGLVPNLVFLAMGATVYVLLFRLTGTADLFSATPFVATAIGLAGGVASAAAMNWIMGHYLEARARRIAFGERNRRVAMLEVATTVAPVLLVAGLIYLMWGPLAGFGSFFVIAGLSAPWVFLHHVRTRTYNRARQLFIDKATADSQTPPPLPPPASARMRGWANALGVLLVVAVLATGAWLQWGLPWRANADPRKYEWETVGGGTATRLTYGEDAATPAISPDGRRLACARGTLSARIEVMDADGRNKRRLGAGKPPYADPVWPLSWSPDGKRILFIGMGAISPLEFMRLARSEPKPTESYAVWSIAVKTGATRRLTDYSPSYDTYVRGMALPPSGQVAVVQSRGRRGGRSIILMDEDGRHRLQVEGLQIGDPSALAPWRGGREVLAVGDGRSAGIWSVDAMTGKATRLSSIQAKWALPLDDKRLVFAVRGRAYPPLRSASSIGVLDTGSGAVRWVVRDLQGRARGRVLTGKNAALLLTLRLDDTSSSLWALRLRDGRLSRITRGGGQGVAATADGSAIYYVAANDVERHPVFALGTAIWRLPGWKWPQAR